MNTEGKVTCSHMYLKLNSVPELLHALGLHFTNWQESPAFYFKRPERLELMTTGAGHLLSE
jgi:hypothetical protein